MGKESILQQLPNKCPYLVSAYTFDRYIQELGGHMAIYKRVAYQAPMDLKRLMEPEDYKPARRTWAGECTCTACGESWHTAWLGGVLKELAVCVGEDDVSYPIFDIEDPDAVPEWITPVSSNDGILCPICGEGVTLIHASKIQGGSTRRLVMCSVENVGSNTALLYWMAYRYIDRYGFVTEKITPWRAFVLDGRGKLRQYCHRHDGWHISRNLSDPFCAKYTSGDGDCYNFRKGGFVCKDVPDLEGFTGEKTGLARYVRDGGQYPLLYLRTWQHRPAIENLVNAGWSHLIESLFRQATHYGEYDIAWASLPEINWESCRPHEMLHMDKASYRNLTEADRSHIGREWFDGWNRYRAAGGRLNALEFNRAWSQFTQYGMNTVLELMYMVPGTDIPRIQRYLNKQFLQPTEVRILADTWRLTRLLTDRADLTAEELWPGNLQRRHDELTALRLDQTASDCLYLAGFQRILSKFGCLQWTDGDLEILLPRTNGDLVREGSTLRHCVGTYGEAHVKEKQTIFFVRRHRRPERSYYTLSMDMRSVPKRVQLHGYGNERHGEYKQYRHSIPQKVLDFCDRWEREVLMPWYMGQQKKEGKTA